MLMFNANVPVEVRQWLRRTGSDAEAVQAMPKSLHLPVLITHGLNGLRRLFPERGSVSRGWPHAILRGASTLQRRTC
jgi:hypothetical protein